MNTQVAKFIAFNVLLNITDLLAPNAKTHVINSVMPKAIKSGVRSAIKYAHKFGHKQSIDYFVSF